MANELSNLKPVPGSTKARSRIGRGEGSGKGKTAGRGQKGQGARGNPKVGFEGGQMPLARRMPKRGFHNIFAKEYAAVRLDRIAERYSQGEVVDAASLAQRGLLKHAGKDGVKVLGNGEIAIALTFRVAKLSRAAAEKITAAGGTIETA